MKPNPPIPGHELLFEGHTKPIWGEGWGSVKGHKGGCRCGAQPDQFPNVSINQMKQWHRQHKEQLRMGDEKLSPERAVRLLRAKAAELENRVLLITEMQEADSEPVYIAATEFKFLNADIALVAQLLADHIERMERLDAEKLAMIAEVKGMALSRDIDDANVRDRDE